MVDNIVKLAELLKIERIDEDTAALINETIRNAINKMEMDNPTEELSKAPGSPLLEPTVMHEWLHGDKPEGG